MLVYVFVLFAIAFRFIPHPMAFTPVGAALLYFGARGARNRMWVPLVLLAGSDVILTTMVYKYPFTWDHFVTWAWYAAMIWLGTNLKQNAGVLRILGAALAGSISFFVLSNFAVCYDAGLPFFRRAVEGDVLFTTLMFGAPVALHALAGWLNKSGDHTAAA
jgi:hypothetical protein